LGTAYNYLAIEHRNAGKIAEALEAQRKALALREALVRDNPEEPEDQTNLGGTLNNIGVLLADKGHQRDALAMYRRAAEHTAAAFARAPQVIGYGRFLAITYSNIARTQRDLGQPAEGLRSYRQCVDVWQKLAGGNPAVPYLRASLWDAYWNLGSYQREAGRAEEAARSIRLAREVLEGLPAEGPGDFRNLASVRARCAGLIAQGKTQLTAAEEAERRHEGDLALGALRQAVAAGYQDVEEIKASEDLACLRGRSDFKELVARLEEAARADALVKAATGQAAERLKAQQEALRIRQKLAGEDPGSRRARADLAASLQAIGLIRVDLGQTEEAAQSLAEALEVRKALVRQAPQDVGYRADLAATCLALGDLEWNAQRLPQAGRQWHNGLELLEAAAREEPHDQQLPTRLAGSERAVGNSYAGIGLWDEAARHYAKAFERQPFIDQDECYYHGLLRLLVGDAEGYRRACANMVERFGHTGDQSRVARACALAPNAGVDPRRVVAMAAKDLAAHLKDAYFLNTLGLAHYRAGQYEQALARFNQVNEVDPNWPPNWPLLAMAHHRLGHVEEARRWLNRADQGHEAAAREALAGTALELRIPSAGTHWQHWAYFRLFRQEAKGLIAEAAPKEDPWAGLLQARAHAKLGQTERAEADLQAAAAVGADDPAIWWARGRLFAQLGKRDRAEADFARALALRPNDPQQWIARGRYFAETGQGQKADADFAKAATLAPDELHRFIEAGWWVVGPYPEDLRLPCPPEKDPDPSRPVAAVGKTRGSGAPAGTAVPQALNWRYAPTGEFGRVDLGPLFNNAEHISAYALTYVTSPEERSAMLLVGGGEAVRVWLNGRLVHENTHPDWWPGNLSQEPVTLRAGRNTLLAKVSKSTKTHSLLLRIADSPMERGLALAELWLWEEAASLVARGRGGQGSEWEELWFYTAPAILYLASGNPEAYRRQCDRIFDRFGLTSNGNVAGAVAQTWGLAAEGVREPGRLVRLAELGLTAMPNGPDAWHLFIPGLAYYRAGRFEQAVQSLTPVSGLEKAWPVLAMAHHRLGHVEEARRWLAKADAWYDNVTRDMLAAPGFNPSRPWRSMWSEWAQFQILDHEAKKLIEGSAYKGDANLQALEARARDELKRRDKATADYDHALKLHPDQPGLWLARGRRFAELKQWDKADADLARAAELNPSDPQLWRERGRIYAESGQPEKAAADFARALAPVPDSADPWFEPWWSDAAGIRDDLARWDEAFDRVVKLRPRDAQLWIARANHFGRQGRWPQAATAMAQVIELDPSDHGAWFQQAAVRLQLGDLEGYRRACRELLSRFGQTNDPMIAARTAQACLLLPNAVSDPQLVTKLAERAVTGTEKHSSYRWFLLVRGMADYRDGRFASALTWLDKSLAADRVPGWPGLDATAHLFLAMAREELKQPDKARQALGNACRLMEQKSPGDPELSWLDWLRFQVVRREAEALAKGTEQRSDRSGR
jgi:tetratricopeptide (TPR) repeat protein